MPGMTDRDHFAAAALTGLLGSREWPIDSEEAARYCYRVADAMLRERAKTNHDAAPAARANAESVAPQPTAGDRAGNPPSHSGTGDTPATRATRGEGSVQRECTEPVAWGVAGLGGILATSISRIDAVDMQSEYAFVTEVVPLYRKPTLTDAEAETLRELRDEAAQYADEIGLCASEVRGRQRIIDGLLERTGGGR